MRAPTLKTLCVGYRCNLYRVGVYYRCRGLKVYYFCVVESKNLSVQSWKFKKCGFPSSPFGARGLCQNFFRFKKKFQLCIEFFLYVVGTYLIIANPIQWCLAKSPLLKYILSQKLSLISRSPPNHSDFQLRVYKVPMTLLEYLSTVFTNLLMSGDSQRPLGDYLGDNFGEHLQEYLH